MPPHCADRILFGRRPVLPQTVAIRHLIIRRHNLGWRRETFRARFIRQPIPVSPGHRAPHQPSFSGIAGLHFQREGIGGGRRRRRFRRKLYLDQFRPHLAPDQHSQSNWWSVASSSDGTKLVAAAGNDAYGNGGIYTSTNSGFTWTQTSAPGSQSVYYVASSSDGSKLVEADYFSAVSFARQPIPGLTWTPTSVPGNPWHYVASSSDGRKLVAVAFGGGILRQPIPVLPGRRPAQRTWSGFSQLRHLTAANWRRSR